MRLQVKPPSKPPAENKIRFVCMSDTHSLTSHIKHTVPDGDVFIHAGDFTRCGSISEVKEFANWLRKLPHKHKVIIAGNHELSFDPTFKNIDLLRSGLTERLPCNHSHKILTIPTLGLNREQLQDAVETTLDMRDELSEFIYLQDSSVTLHGLKIYGTPWQPEFCGWAFNLPRGQPCLDKWAEIPDDTDILITHTPPLGYGDLCCTGGRAGCVELLNTVQNRVRPKYHIYGHVHEGYGVRSDGKVIYINASTCDINYMPSNQAVVFDVPCPLA